MIDRKKRTNGFIEYISLLNVNDYIKIFIEF